MIFGISVIKEQRKINVNKCKIMLTHEDRNNYNLIYEIVGFYLTSRTQGTLKVKIDISMTIIA